MSKKTKAINAKANTTAGKSLDSNTPSIKASYDASQNRARRRSTAIDLKHEDRVLLNKERDKVVSDARNLRRNASIARWAINKHLDYVSTFTFQCRTGIPELDDRVEALMQWWSKPLNCDVTGRFSLQRLIRMGEGLRTTDGDCLFMKLSDGRLQLIEGDCIRTPNNLGEFTGKLDTSGFVHGVEVTDSGKHLRYAVAARELNGFVLKAIIPEQYCFHHGYFDRYDQVRGISPLASAINTFCDLYEAQEYALAKMKLAQILALKISRGSIPEGETSVEPYSFDFSGPQTVELDPGDDAQFLESANPSNEFQAFMQTGIQTALKSLDIPFSFYAENYTNYSGARQALLQYEQGAAIKRLDNQQLYGNITLWRLGLFIQDGILELPKGMTISDINFEWIPSGIPWIDPLKEAQAETIRIQNRTASRQQLAKEHGKDWFDIADQLAAEEAYLVSKGLPTDNGVVAAALNSIVIDNTESTNDSNNKPNR